MFGPSLQSYGTPDGLEAFNIKARAKAHRCRKDSGLARPSDAVRRLAGG